MRADEAYPLSPVSRRYMIPELRKGGICDAPIGVFRGQQVQGRDISRPLVSTDFYGDGSIDGWRRWKPVAS
jgi:hypothetical protein